MNIRRWDADDSVCVSLVSISGMMTIIMAVICGNHKV